MCSCINPLPVATDSAELIYSSHTIEHIDDASLQNMLNESYRMLKPRWCYSFGYSRCRQCLSCLEK
ncbi:MAG: class I SAM-dependent methyltransferase [Bacteroidetes bacterium]|nr:class I SAM-dependent methyltransferase [Bacteroidota bacterium]